MHIETSRLIVRDFAAGDLEDLHAILGDGEVMREVEPPYSREKTAEFLRTFCIERRGAFAAAERETGKVVGYLLFKPYGEPEIYEMGWIFNRAYWRRGYAFESCRALIAHGFSVMGLHKICAETTDDVISGGLMRKLGMKPEGIQRAQTRNADGEWADLYWYGLVASASLL
ncbi:MAG: GNAT family N-acetyltransferase [Oscillospiraceae bacterium]|jgi:RimJ/RimL family protein N-acetyltransferase|nr:GNAT family N-acetyltransferase [Oscillospiraceae bacterium]